MMPPRYTKRVLLFVALLAVMMLTTPTFGQSAYITTLAWSPDGTRIAEGRSDGMVVIRDAARNQVIHTLNGHTQIVYIVAWSPIQSVNRLASTGPDLTVRIWDTNSGTLVRTLTGHQNPVSELLWSLAGSQLVSTALSYDNPSEFRVWDATTGNLLRDLRLGDIHDMRWNLSGSQLAGAGSLGGGILNAPDFTLATRLMYPEPTGQGYDSMKIAWHPNGTAVVAGSANSTIRVWNATTGQITLTIPGENILGISPPYPTNIVAITFNANGNQILGLRADGKLRRWDATTGQLLEETQLSVTGIIYDAAFSPDLTRVAYGDASSAAHILPLPARDPATSRLPDTLAVLLLMLAALLAWLVGLR